VIEPADVTVVGLFSCASTSVSTSVCNLPPAGLLCLLAMHPDESVGSDSRHISTKGIIHPQYHRWCQKIASGGLQKQAVGIN
jgi:hypothetical protein